MCQCEQENSKKKLISWINTLKHQCDTTKFTTISWLFLFLHTFSSSFFFFVSWIRAHCLKFSKSQRKKCLRYESQSQSQSKCDVCVLLWHWVSNGWKRRACQPTHIIKLNDLPQHRCTEPTSITESQNKKGEKRSKSKNQA